jgi:hypothetical protein
MCRDARPLRRIDNLPRFLNLAAASSGKRR